mmetsp:Transcript_98969/g.319080  ORF Transcript_98969/g.319080 Transcript_98969/m.319080 type:complete len:343 (-) Transcript_98969:486-1514(-)
MTASTLRRIGHPLRFACRNGIASRSSLTSAYWVHHSLQPPSSMLRRQMLLGQLPARGGHLQVCSAAVAMKDEAKYVGHPPQAHAEVRTAEPTAAAPALAAAPWMVVFLPAMLLPGSLADADYRWLFESLVGYGSVGMGVQGLVSWGIFVNPMLEAMPRIRREGTVGKLPLLPYSAMAAQGLVWITYGVLVNNPAIWTPNFVALVFGVYYWSVYSRFCPAGADWLPFTQRHHQVGFVATAALCAVSCTLLDATSAVTVLGLTGNVMTMAMFGGPLAAMRTVIKEKSTRAMPLGFTCIVNLNCNMWFFYAYFMLNDPYIYFQDGVGLLLTTVQLALFARYGIHR